MKTIKELEKEIKEIEDFVKAGGYFDKEDRLSEIEKQDMLNLRFLMTELQAKKEVLELGEPIHDCNEECKGYETCNVQESIIIKKSKITGE